MSAQAFGRAKVSFRTYRLGGRVLLSTDHTAICFLQLAGEVSAPFQAIGEFVDELTSGEVGKDLRATFELCKLIHQFPSFEGILARGKL